MLTPMATRLRKIIWITAAVVLAPVVLAAFYLSYLALRPAPPLPRSGFLKPPAHLSAATGRGQVTLTWEAVPGAISYRVFRSGKADGGYRELGAPLEGASAIVRLIQGPSAPPTHVPRPPYADTLVENRTYYYRVRAFDGSGWSEPSPPVEAAPGGGNGSVWVHADAARETGLIEHTWEVAIGSEHLGYYLKEDAGRGLRNAGVALRRSNKRLHDAFGFRYVRAHGILMDILGSYREAADGKAVYDWSRVDVIYDNLLADGLRPFVELSFMPSALAANPRQTIFEYKAITSPPRDYRKWADFVGAFARHLIERYGREEVATWPFEVWNEPDLSVPFAGSLWRGTQEDYYRLYDLSAQAVKAADARIRVGGPAAAKVESVEPFLKHIASSNPAGSGRAPLDFLSVHVFGGLPLDFNGILERYGFHGLPVYYTAWGLTSQVGALENDLPYGAAWVAGSVIQAADKVAMISYWTGSDYFEEHGAPRQILHGGLGLLGIDGLRKPRYWAFYMLHQLDGPKIALQGGGDGFGGLVQACAVKSDDGRVKIVVSNAARESSQAGGNPELDREVTLKVSGLAPGTKYQLRHFRVDNTHTNIHAQWISMGKPAWPKPVPLAELRHRDLLELFEDDKEITVGNEGAVELQFALPMPGLSLLVFSPVSTQ